VDGMEDAVFRIRGAEGGLVVNFSLRSRSSPDVVCKGSCELARSSGIGVMKGADVLSLL
jgi:hypothetical protein